MLKNDQSKFGIVTIVIHWASALIIIGQFGFGLYMLSLDYYDANYNVLPHYHKSIGILFAILLLFRIVWSSVNPQPAAAPGVKTWEHKASSVVQKLLLAGLVIVVILGYLISTATGDSIWVFNWFEIPAIITNIDSRSDIIGELHYWFALGVILLASLHALAALKHHFIDRDTTLMRMLKRG